MRMSSALSSWVEGSKTSSWEDFFSIIFPRKMPTMMLDDSSESISSNLLSGVVAKASGVVSGGGIMGDLIDFLELNVNGFQL